MTFLEAAEQVLRTAKRPLSAREITDLAIKRGLLTTAGRTPEQTMSARLYGAPSNSPVRREYMPGTQRAVRGSVRWVHVGKD